MRIGIITQALLNNYGGILQNYALQTILRNLGHESITIDYISHYSLRKYIIYSLKTIIYLLLGRKYRRKFIPYYRRRNSMMEDFVGSNIFLTKPVKKYSADVIDSYKLDGLIVGSDQVWRPEYNNDLYDMFLLFAKGKNCLKMSYAASFGIDKLSYSTKQIKKCKELIQNFKSVSVRENSGVTLCKEYFNIDATEVLDPTLLLTNDSYENICSNIPKSNIPFLATYILDVTPDKRNLVNKIAKEKTLHVRYFEADINAKLSIQEWLAMFRDADFVITDSFHGTLFSIIFKKEFLTIGNKSRGLSRFHSILSKLKLDDRLIFLSSKENISLNKIDWDKVYNIINRNRRESLNFLQTNLLNV